MAANHSNCRERSIRRRRRRRSTTMDKYFPQKGQGPLYPVFESSSLPSTYYGAIFFSSFLVLLLLKFLVPKGKKLPPGPWGLPIIGHLHLMRRPINRCFHKFSQQYGPMVSLRFGSRRVLLVTSPDVARECFTTHDIIFANRPASLVGKYIHYSNTTIASSSYGDRWRGLRKLTVVELLSTARINSFHDVRRDAVELLMRRLHRQSGGGEFARVEPRTMLRDLTFNIMLRMVAGKRYYGEDVSGVEESQEGKLFREIIRGIQNSQTVLVAADLIPMLSWADIGGHEKRLDGLRKRMDSFFQQLIEDAKVNRGTHTLINHLLHLQESEPDYYTDEIIKGLIVVVLQGGTDTTSKTLEWILANLLNNPEVLRKAKLEVDTQVGQDRLVDEADVPNMPYLQCIITENFRLSPTTPMLVPHMSSSDLTIRGYHVPRGTMLMVNQWAIQRDPKLWEDPLSFKPERFMENKSEASRVVPFGLGRRACPGDGLANRIVTLTLASLLQCFEWDRVSGEEIDMTETVFTSMQLATPLKMMCKSRPNTAKLLS